MSALFAFHNLDGRPLDPEILQQAETAMERRGVRFVDIQEAGRTGLGYVANHPKEGSLFTHAETQIKVIADARLDNKTSLAGALNLTDDPSIAEIIAHAYLKWGRECPAYLDGDFALVIWDPRHNHMFGARDRLGLKQLLYHFAPDKVFGCATDAKALFSHGRIPKRINEARLLDFFVGALEGVDKVCTAYDGINRLPPGHSFLLKDGQFSIAQYWTLEPEEPLRLKTQDEFIEAFKSHFNTAVARRFDSPDTTGVMVSGGMDSSASAAMAAKKFGADVQTFSAINSSDPHCVESQMIRLVNDHLSLCPNYIDLAKSGSWMGDVKSGLAEIADPFDSNMNLMRATCGSAQRQGMTVLMDGAWGDTVFAPGSHVRRLMRSGHLKRAYKALKSDRDYHNELGPIGPVYLKMLASSFTPAELKAALAPLKYKRQAAHFETSLGLSSAFTTRHKLHDRLASLGGHVGHDSWRNAHIEAAEIISHPYHLVARERYDRVAGHFGLIMRDPFTDLDLVTFCLSLPTAQKTARGIPKILLREAMANDLPPPVLSRLSKEHLGHKFTSVLYEAEKNVLTNSEELLSAFLSSDKRPVGAMIGDEDINPYFVANWMSVSLK